MSTRSRELIAADESTAIAKSTPYVVVVEDREGDGRLAHPPPQLEQWV